MEKVLRIVVIAIATMILASCALEAKLLSNRHLNRTNIPHWKGSGQITYTQIPVFVTYKDRTIRLKRWERAKIAQVLNIVSIGETGLGGRFNTKGWYSRCGSAKRLRTVRQLLRARRGSTASGMFQILKRVLREETRVQKINRAQRFTPKLQIRIITNRMIRLRGLLEFVRSKLSTYSFARHLAKEFASIEDPRIGRSRYGQRVGMSYKLFSTLSRRRRA